MSKFWAVRPGSKSSSSSFSGSDDYDSSSSEDDDSSIPKGGSDDNTNISSVEEISDQFPKMRARDFGRRLPPHPQASGKFDVDKMRQIVLLDTLQAFEDASTTQRFHKLAMSNLKRWQNDACKVDATTAVKEDDKLSPSHKSTNRCKVDIVPGDWGTVTSTYTQKYGKIFAVLNMANAYRPGGGYPRGCAAQEENMFRRTDCHFSIDWRDTDTVKTLPDGDVEYTSGMSDLLNGKLGKVYLDTNSPRVCIRGPEDLSTISNESETFDDIGYDFLSEDCIFPFLELGAAAVDRRGMRTNKQQIETKLLEDMRRRIVAQLQTLMDANIRHVVLSAFGCGAFRNPAKDVAILYREEIERRAEHFDVIVFAIFHAGYGPNNFIPFQAAFEGFDGGQEVDPVDAFSTPPRPVRHSQY